MGDGGLVEQTAELLTSITNRASAGTKKMQASRDQVAERREQDLAVSRGLIATSSYVDHDIDDGTGLRAVGQDSRAFSHGPEPDRLLTIKRTRKLR